MSEHTEYLVIFEEGEHSVGAYVPDLPGCVAVGENRAGVKQRIREAIELHIENLREKASPFHGRTHSSKSSLSKCGLTRPLKLTRPVAFRGRY